MEVSKLSLRKPEVKVNTHKQVKLCIVFIWTRGPAEIGCSFRANLLICHFSVKERKRPPIPFKTGEKETMNR